MATPINIDLCQEGIYFTSKDILEVEQVLLEGEVYTIQGLVEYFNGKLKCNNIIKLLEQLVDEGLKYAPKFNIKPVTEKCEVTNGQFKLTQQPIPMQDSYFINNLVVVRLKDENNNLTNQYEFFDDVKVDPNTLMCTIKDSTHINGVASVSYFTYVD